MSKLSAHQMNLLLLVWGVFSAICSNGGALGRDP